MTIPVVSIRPCFKNGNSPSSEAVGKQPGAAIKRAVRIASASHSGRP